MSDQQTNALESLPVLLFLNVGYGVSEDHKPLTKFWIITDAARKARELPDEPTEFCLPEKAAARANMSSIGAIYAVQSDGAVVRPATAKMVGRWPIDDDVARWSALSHARRRDDDALRAAKKEAQVDKLRDRLEPIRRAYWQAIGNQRTQLVALVVEMITRRTPL